MALTHLIVDAWSVFIGGYRASQDVSEKGNPCGGIVKLLNSVSELAESIRPNSIHLVWESTEPSTFRRDALPEYKSKDLVSGINRPYGESEGHAYENLAWQVSFLINVFGMAGVRCYLVDDYEADDLIVHLTKKIRGLDDSCKVSVLSSNNDLYPLLAEGKIDLYRPRAQMVDQTTIEGLTQEYGFDVSNWHLAKAIVGDKSKGIPGVRGVGWKKMPMIPSMLEPNADVDSVCNTVGLHGGKAKTPKWVSTLTDESTRDNLIRSLRVIRFYDLDDESEQVFDEQFTASVHTDYIGFEGELSGEGLRNIRGTNLWRNLSCDGRYCDPAKPMTNKEG